MLYSFNYVDIDKLNKAEDHKEITRLVINAAQKLENASADCLLLCANTMHMYVDELLKHTSLPLIHIADAAAAEIKKQGFSQVGLLGTRWTMEMDFYTKRLEDGGIKTIVPEKPEREFIHKSIMEEFAKEIFLEETKDKFLKIINDLEQKGAPGIVLGCTEIPLLIKQADCHLPIFNTLELHARAVVEFALA
ncbi:amino acid racemase [bacterium BMS3Abin03]|nr:amino acid racemase [bacterium BMS3Abin03]MCG6958682.1 amino acid racemase [bacterium BMS3Abin03]